MFALAVGLVSAACSGASREAREVSEVVVAKRHFQVVHAMKTPARRALVERFRQRNPTRFASWTVNDDALVSSLTVVDPFAGFLRRARRVEPRSRHVPSATRPIDQERAAIAARAFVRKNADLLGLPQSVVSGLAERIREVMPSDHASPRAAWVVRLDAPFASKGYEGFEEVDNFADIEVIVDDGGEVSSFVNLSRIHPHLLLDTKPNLAQDDPRIVSSLVGRRVFALGEGAFDGSPLGTTRRIALGELGAEDVTRMQLVIHESKGPEFAWMSYRLGYIVEFAKPASSGVADDVEPDADGPRFFFFRYVVDADTGEVLEDARVPLVGAVSMP